jgi:hypothetical protein
VPLLGQRPQRLGEQLEGVHPHGDLAGAGAEQRAGDADPVADLEQLVLRELGTQLLGLEVELDLPLPSSRCAKPALPCPRSAINRPAIRTVSPGVSVTASPRDTRSPPRG